MITGVFGGTFNPVHYGHLRAAEEAAEVLGLKKVLFLPSGVPPLKNSGLASAGHRAMMVGLAISGNPVFSVSSIEVDARDRSYTVDTISALRREYPGQEFVFILGLDSFLDMHLWKDPGRLLTLCDFLVVARPGRRFESLAGRDFHDITAQGLMQADGSPGALVEGGLGGGRRLWLYNMPPLTVSSTLIRGLVSAGRSVRYLLPESVESYIMSHGLYRG